MDKELEVLEAEVVESAKTKAQVPEQQAQVPATPATLLAMAVSQNADIDKLEKLMGLQERWEANEARKAYHSAMAAFKADPPEISKDKHVSYKQTNYHHASLANVTSTINRALSAHGLSAGWKMKQDESGILVTCTITHILGHSESNPLKAEADTTGSKNAIQAIGSTLTYLERYTLLALVGLATHDQDNDGRGDEVECITEEQRDSIMTIITDNNLTEDPKYLPRLYKYLKVNTLAEVTDYQNALAAVNKGVKGKKGKK